MPSITPERWLQLGPLLDVALELPVRERSAWLAALRARAPDDARDLEQLLGADGTSWLETGHRTRVLGRMAASPAEAGAVLGAWRLERTLGRGGMGTVWLATRADGRFAGNAAVKLLHPSLIEGLGEDYFRREGEVLARLTHPAIARLYDAGVTDEGQPYLVLEYVDGRPLHRWLAEQSPTLDRRLALFLRVCDAVAHAHTHGIVHRDIKPANLAITVNDEVKLLDFGIAVLVDDPVAATSDATTPEAPDSLDAEPVTASAPGSASDSVRPFTPKYAAPEQIHGGVITTATDVFALGRLLEELLADLPDAPRDLRLIARRAVQRAPEARYVTVSALGDDVRRQLRHEPVDAREGGAWYRAGRFARRHRVGLVAGMIAVVALVTGTIVSVLQARDARVQRDLAVAAERRARVMSEVMLTLATELPTTDASARAVDALRRTRVLLDGYLASDRRERSRLAVDLARQFGFFARPTEAQALLTDARSDAYMLGDSALAIEIECLLGAGGDTLDQADAMQALATLRARAPRTAWRAHAACASAASRRHLMQFAGDSANAQSALAVRLARDAGDTVSLLYANLLVDQLQTIGWSAGDFHAKRAAYREASAALDRLGLGTSVAALRVATLLAGFARETGRVLVADSALAPWRAYLEAGERWRASTPALLLEQAQVSAILARPDQARMWFERALVLTRTPGSELLAIRSRQLYAQFLAESGDARTARAHVDTLTTLLARSSNSAFDAARVRTLAALYAAEGQPARAASVLDSLLRARGYPTAVRLVSWQDAVAEHAHYQEAIGAYATAREAIAQLRRVAGTDSIDAHGTWRLARLALLEARMRARDDAASLASAARSAAAQLAVAVGPDHPLTREALALTASSRP
jgi:serine/threonine-protein kinase